jgi:SpoVK/Ycf46/Vps4 family AAA+-type ATPase
MSESSDISRFLAEELVLSPETTSRLSTLISKGLSADDSTFLDLDGHGGAAGLLIEGQGGAGKTTLLKSLIKMPHVAGSVLDLASLRALSAGKAAQAVLTFFAAARAAKGARLYLLDNVDAISDAECGAAVLVSALLRGLDTIISDYHHANGSSSSKFVVATCTDVKVVPRELLTHVYLGRQPLPLLFPGLAEREQILRNLFDIGSTRQTVEITGIEIEQEQGEGEGEGDSDGADSAFVVSLARATAGFSHGDLLQMVRSVVYRTDPDHGNEAGDAGACYRLSAQALLYSAMEWHPSSSTTGSGSSNNPRQGLTLPPRQPPLLVGVEEAQARLSLAIQSLCNDAKSLHNHHGHECGGLGLQGLLSAQKPCSGVLLCGPPGSGKTALVDWMAYLTRHTHKLITVPCADLVHKVVGESEKRLTSFFAMARSVAPCLLVLDNVDIIFGTNARGDDATDGNGGNHHHNDNNNKGGYSSRSNRASHAALDRLLSTLLIELDGITTTTTSSSSSPPSSSSSILVVATAVDPACLDKALKRPGRLEEHIVLGLPTARNMQDFFQQQVTARLCPTGHSSHPSKEGGEESKEEQEQEQEREQKEMRALARAVAESTMLHHPEASYATLHQVVQEASQAALRAYLLASKEQAVESGNNRTNRVAKAQEAFLDNLRTRAAMI